MTGGNTPPLDPDFDPRTALAIYVHVPFCGRRCPYCDFAIAVRREIPHQAYGKAVRREFDARIGRYREDKQRRPLTLYFGGGTPSLWRVTEVADTIEHILADFDRSELLEVTLEANPEDVNSEWAVAIAAAGVTRVSLGQQAISADRLAQLGRAHGAESAAECVEALRGAGLEINLDLIFGTEGHEPEDLARELGHFTALDVDHVSAYGLTIEDGTAFGRRAARGERVASDDDVQAALYELVTDVLATAGFARYEVSNLALAGAWSRHNVCYWLGSDYIGLGMGAHSKRDLPDGSALREAATKNLRRYLEAPVASLTSERVAPAPAAAERTFAALRTRFAHDLNELVGESLAATVAAALETARAQGWLEVLEDGRVRTTERGLLVQDSVAYDVYDALLRAAR